MGNLIVFLKETIYGSRFFQYFYGMLVLQFLIGLLILVYGTTITIFQPNFLVLIGFILNENSKIQQAKLSFLF